MVNLLESSHSANPFRDGYTRKSGKFTLYYKTYSLELKHIFTVASNSRSSTPVVLVALAFEDYIGFGEASMPPYLGESHKSVLDFLEKIDLSIFSSPFLTEDILHYVEGIKEGNTAAKASVDIALHDLLGKIMEQPWHRIWGYNPENTPNTSFTIGIDKADVVRMKVAEAKPYKLLKVKLGLDSDKMMINTIRELTDTPICVDVNQGWTDKEQALEMAHWLAEQGVVFIEQPMPKELVDDNVWLTERSPIPTIADEAVQRLSDVHLVKGVYSGINIKLMKCTGMREAKRMVELARNLELKVMLGCMTETSCAISAAAQLAPVVDWADLDGALLVSNDLYEGMWIDGGKIKLPKRSGIGVRKI